MASPEAETERKLDIANLGNLNDIFRSLQDSDIFNIVESITFDVQSQKVIVQMQKLVGNTLKKEADEIQRERASTSDTADPKFIKLSEMYKHKYPELLTFFRNWKPCREKLITTLKSAAKSIHRNSTYVSSFRILMSAVDIFGTSSRIGGQSSAGSWCDYAMEHASTFGILAVYLEMIISKNTFKDVKKIIRQDEEAFKKIIQWFKETKEMDAVIKSLFPYGIDPEIVKKIEKSSLIDITDYNKIFMSIVASNVKKNVKLFKNKEFLDKAEQVSSSEVGKQWFHKVLLENDPYLIYSLGSELCSEIQDLLRSISEELSPSENKQMYLEACRLLKNKADMKMFISVFNIIGAANNLLFQHRPEASVCFQRLATITQEELTKIQDVVLLLKPSEMETDPTLL